MHPGIEMESRSARQSTNIKPLSGEEAADLPEEVVIKEILPRLPVKSLLRFRCVSKYWCSLIGSKSFIKQHLTHSIRISRFAHLFFVCNEDEEEIKQCSLTSFFDKSFTDLITLNAADLGIDLDLDFYFRSGCCNGLVCVLENNGNFILWNPTTKKIKYLPSIYNKIQVENGHVVAYGFGFDELDDDYKVFGKVYHCGANEPIHCISMIYSLGTNSWKVIEEKYVSPAQELGVGVYVSGKLHWCRREGHERYIVSFDLNSHVYEVVELPSHTKGVLHSVGVTGDCLSAHFRHPNNDIDVWLWKEYGVKESLDKVATVPYRLDICEVPTPFAIGPNGEVLLKYLETIMIYDPRSDVFRKPQIPGIDNISIVSMGIYIESLASIDPNTEQER